MSWVLRALKNVHARPLLNVSSSAQPMCSELCATSASAPSVHELAAQCAQWSERAYSTHGASSSRGGSTPVPTFSFTAPLTGPAAQNSFSSQGMSTVQQQSQELPAGPSQAPYTALSPPVIISPTLCRVVVIGWMGCKRKYMQKYSDLWLRSGDNEVLSIRPSIPMTLFRWRGIVTAGPDIDRVARMHIENGGMPTIYHIFSTGGFIHAGTMWKWMNQVEDVFIRRSLLEEVKGIIFDSGPAKPTEDMVSRALVSATLGSPAHSLESQPLMRRCLSSAQAAVRWYMQKGYLQLREQEVLESWYELAPVCPQLYLYSESDTLANPRDVERYMQIQATRGVEVFSHKWPDSGHCEHYRRHPHDYAFQVSQFAKHALRDW